MNQILRRQLTKLVIETRLPWTKCLLLALLSSRTAPPKDIGVSPYEMLYELSHLGQPLGLPSLKPKTSSSKTMYLVFPQSCHPLGIKDYWLRPTMWVSSTPTSAQRLPPGQNLQQSEAWAVPVETIPGATHYWDSSVCRWKRMDPLHLNKASTPGGALGWVF
jgi:hypothetical protein